MAGMDILKRLDTIKEDFEKALKSCQAVQHVEDLRVKYVGRKGELTSILRSISSLSSREKREIGNRANILKNGFADRLQSVKKEIKARSQEKSEALDITMPGICPGSGTRHPLTRTITRINEIFISLGFSIAEGPEVDTEFYNFEALNIPLDHPSRDAFDTFYIDNKFLLRSHTSNVQIHIMQNQGPPIQAIMPGRVYRPDAVDVSHSFMFHQVEGLMVDRDVTFADLKGMLSVFCRSMFGDDIKMRLRPHFFPFTEPSAEIDISCIICKGKGCRVCSGN